MEILDRGRETRIFTGKSSYSKGGKKSSNSRSQERRRNEQQSRLGVT
jgi:hypothetical protein